MNIIFLMVVGLISVRFVPSWAGQPHFGKCHGTIYNRTFGLYFSEQSQYDLRSYLSSVRGETYECKSREERSFTPIVKVYREVQDRGLSADLGWKKGDVSSWAIYFKSSNGSDYRVEEYYLAGDCTVYRYLEKTIFYQSRLVHTIPPKKVELNIDRRFCEVLSNQSVDLFVEKNGLTSKKIQDFIKKYGAVMPDNIHVEMIELLNTLCLRVDISGATEERLQWLESAVTKKKKEIDDKLNPSSSWF